jgi:6-phosphogluconolactonase
MPNLSQLLTMCIPVLMLPACSIATSMGRSTVAYVANADSQSISVLKLNAESGRFETEQTVVVGGAVMPMAIAPDQRFLYASLRSTPYSVMTLAIDGQTGHLKPLESAALPDSMANLAVDRSGRWLLGASYGGHLMSVSPIKADGTVSIAASVISTGKNAHAAVVDVSNRHVFVTNLGNDQIMQFKFDSNTGRVSPNAEPLMQTRPGSGPRHLIFHPDGRHAYLSNELDGSVDLLSYDGQNGRLSPLKSWSILPDGFIGQPWAADLHLTPDGRFLYTSERHSSTIGMWSIDMNSGELSLLGYEPTEKQPRGFQIDPTGRWLLVVGQLSNALSVYKIDDQTGRLMLQSQVKVGGNPNWVEIIQLQR